MQWGWQNTQPLATGNLPDWGGDHKWTQKEMCNPHPGDCWGVGGRGSCSSEGQREGPNEDATKGSKKAFLRKWRMLTKSDHKCWNWCLQKQYRWWNCTRCQLTEERLRGANQTGISKEEVQAGWSNKTRFQLSPLTSPRGKYVLRVGKTFRHKVVRSS